MDTIVRIPLHSNKYPGLFALVDAADVALVAGYHWSVMRDHNTFYAIRTVQIGKRPNRRTRGFKMHREIMGVSSGTLVDHRDGDGLNNTRTNLRACTHVQNLGNHRRSSSNTSGYMGVSLFPRTGRYKVTINHAGARLHLGYFATAEEAARAYDAKARELRGTFAHLNFPDAPYVKL